jgi:hypothetical protein
VFWVNFFPSRQRTGLVPDRYRLDDRIPDFIGLPLKRFAKVQQKEWLSTLILDQPNLAMSAVAAFKIRGRARIGKDWGRGVNEKSVSNALSREDASTAMQ